MGPSLLDILRTLSSEPRGGVPAGRSLRTKVGQALYFQGDPSDAVYVLVAGEVRLSVSLGEETQPQITLLCQAPTVLGDRDLLAGVPSREHVLCLQACEVRIVDGASFREEWAQSTVLREWLM